MIGFFVPPQVRAAHEEAFRSTQPPPARTEPPENRETAAQRLMALQRSQRRAMKERDEKLKTQPEATRPTLDGKTLFDYGMKQLEGTRYKRAAKAFGDAVESTPNEPRYHAFLGWAQFRAAPTGDTREPLANIKKAIDLDPSYALSHFFCGVIVMTHGNDELAMTCFETAVRLDRDLVQAQQYLREVRERRAEEVQEGTKERGTLGKARSAIKKMLGGE